MKKKFLNFGHAPKIYSHRFKASSSFRGASYKSDADPADDPAKIEIKTAADLLKELGEIKISLEKKSKEDAKAEVEEQLKAVNASLEEVKNMKPEVTAEELKKVKSDLDITIKAFDKLQIILKRQGNPSKVEAKSFNDRILEAVEENQDSIEKFKRKEIKKFSIEVKAAGAVSTASVSGGSVFGAIYQPGIIPMPSTMTHMRDLIPLANAGPGTDYYFMKETTGQGAPAATGETTNAAAPTTTATGLKPQFDVALAESSVPFQYIAGWLLMSRKAMNNIPGFSNFLQRRLPVKLMDAEDQQILYGTGTAPQIKGILNSGNYTAGSAAGATPLIEKIINDMSLLEDTYKRLATGIALRPKDWFSFFTNKASGSGEYDLPRGVMFLNNILYIMGVPVAKTTSLNEYDYIVGDFQNGTELLVQSGMNIEFFEQDSTNVRSNQITVRVEESVALPVYNGDYFILGSSNTSTGSGS